MQIPSNSEITPEQFGFENNMVLGQVIGIHVRDEVITKGTIDISKFDQSRGSVASITQF